MSYKSTEEVKCKAAELSDKLGVKVHPLTFINRVKGEEDKEESEELVAGFVKEPGRLNKSRAMDKVSMGMPSVAYAELLEACLIKEESDPRLYSKASENDKYVLGAEQFCGGLLIISQDVTEVKKK